MDKNKIKYKEYIIIPEPWETRDKKGWLPKAEVQHHFGAGVKVTPLESDKIMSSYDDAIKYSIAMAKQWIDNKRKKIRDTSHFLILPY